MGVDPAARATLARGVRLFNEGHFFEAHEVWEELWLATEEPLRRYVQGLIQIAAGWHHLRNGNDRGGRRVLEAGLAKLDPFPPGFAGVDAASAVAESRRILSAPGSPSRALPTMRLV